MTNIVIFFFFLIKKLLILFQFNQKQLENLVDGILAIGDKNGDKRITFDEYVLMAADTFVVNFAPNNLKKLFRY
jgi:hypothetical protein